MTKRKKGKCPKSKFIGQQTSGFWSKEVEDHSWPDSYLGYRRSLRTLLNMMTSQATGVPSGNHGLFHRLGKRYDLEVWVSVRVLDPDPEAVFCSFSVSKSGCRSCFKTKILKFTVKTEIEIFLPKKCATKYTTNYIQKQCSGSVTFC
jgi:hypothetical protein